MGGGATLHDSGYPEETQRTIGDCTERLVRRGGGDAAGHETPRFVTAYPGGAK